MDPRTPPPRRRRELLVTPAPLDPPCAACPDGKRARTHEGGDLPSLGVLCALPLVFQHLALADRARAAVSRAWLAGGEEPLAWEHLVLGRHAEPATGFYLTDVRACHLELDQLRVLPSRLKTLCEFARHVTLVVADGAVPPQFQRLRFPRLERATVCVPGQHGVASGADAFRLAARLAPLFGARELVLDELRALNNRVFVPPHTDDDCEFLPLVQSFPWLNSVQTDQNDYWVPFASWGVDPQHARRLAWVSDAPADLPPLRSLEALGVVRSAITARELEAWLHLAGGCPQLTWLAISTDTATLGPKDWGCFAAVPRHVEDLVLEFDSCDLQLEAGAQMGEREVAKAVRRLAPHCAVHVLRSDSLRGNLACWASAMEQMPRGKRSPPQAFAVA